MRFWAMFFAGMLAWSVGRALDLPIWTGWQAGDRADLVLSAVMLVYCLTRPARPSDNQRPVLDHVEG